MLAVYVVLTSTVDFRTNAVYVGGVPLAEHDSLYPGNAWIIEAGKSTFGEANNKQKHWC